MPLDAPKRGLGGPRAYASDWLLGDEIWRLKFMKRLRGGNSGWCLYDEQVLQVRGSLGREEMFLTFLHEVLHALDAAYKIGLKHEQIYALERPLADLLIENGAELFNILFPRPRRKHAAKKPQTKRSPTKSKSKK